MGMPDEPRRSRGEDAREAVEDTRGSEELWKSEAGRRRARTPEKPLKRQAETSEEPSEESRRREARTPAKPRRGEAKMLNEQWREEAQTPEEPRRKEAKTRDTIAE